MTITLIIDIDDRNEIGQIKIRYPDYVAAHATFFGCRGDGGRETEIRTIHDADGRVIGGLPTGRTRPCPRASGILAEPRPISSCHRSQ